MLAASPAAAQADELPAGFHRDLARAETLMSHGDYDEALIILEKIQLRVPDNQKILNLLQRAYQRTKQYDKLLDLLLPRLSVSEDRVRDAAAIADCQFKLGSIEAAESTLTELLEIPPADSPVYRAVAQTYLQNGRYAQAAEIYLRARELLGKPTLFSQELADLYERRRDYAKAIREYFIDLQENPRRLKTVHRKIAAIVQMEEGSTELTEALKQLVAENPDNFFARRLYAESLLESGHAESAWPEYLAADRLAENPTEHIIYFIGRCLEDELYSLARQAILTFFERYEVHSSTVDVRLAYARSMTGLGHPDSAIIILHGVAELFKLPDRKAEIAYEIANVYFDHLNDLDSAEFYYRQVLTMSNRREAGINSSIRRGDCRLRRGDLAGADSAYAECERMRLKEEQKEAVLFKRAELLLFAGQYDSLVTALKSLVADHPRGYYVNDAIALSMRINENREPFDWSLKKFAAAALKRQQERLDSARMLFWELAADSANGLADDALFELGRLYARAGQPDSAVIAFGLLIERYPNGFLVPAALTEQGEVYIAGLGRPDSARAAFRRVLTEFGDSPYLEEARRRLKNLNHAPSGG
jgi:tetratricopeptide (TPR) repeat protein